MCARWHVLTHPYTHTRARARSYTHTCALKTHHKSVFLSPFASKLFKAFGVRDTKPSIHPAIRKFVILGRKAFPLHPTILCVCIDVLSIFKFQRFEMKPTQKNEPKDMQSSYRYHLDDISWFLNFEARWPHSLLCHVTGSQFSDTVHFGACEILQFQHS